MGLTIHKYLIHFGTSETPATPMPFGAKPLHVGSDPKLTDMSVLWALVDPEAIEVDVWLGFFWTGKPIPRLDKVGLHYVGSHLNDGWEMRHVIIGPLNKEGCVTAPDIVIANMHRSKLR